MSRLEDLFDRLDVADGQAHFPELPPRIERLVPFMEELHLESPDEQGRVFKLTWLSRLSRYLSQCTSVGQAERLISDCETFIALAEAHAAPGRGASRPRSSRHCPARRHGAAGPESRRPVQRDDRFVVPGPLRPAAPPDGGHAARGTLRPSC